MCYDEGTLQAYIDNELDEITAKNVEEHLKTCEICRNKLEELKYINAFTSKALKTSNIDLNEAWMALNEKLSKNSKGGILTMFTKYKKAIAAAAVAVFIASSILFPPLKNVEAEILNLLRLNKVQVVTITPDDIRQIQNEFYKRDMKNIDLKEYGDIKVSGNQEGYSIPPNEIDKLTSDVNYQFKLPTDKNYEIKHIYVEKVNSLEFILNVNKTNELIKAFGGTHLLPSELDKKPVVLEIGKGISISMEGKSAVNGEKVYVNLSLAPIPKVTVPEGVDVDKVIDALTNLPFLPENLKKQIANANWKETMPLPMMTSDVNIKEVDIRGNKGILAASKGLSDYVHLLWTEDGILYELNIYREYKDGTPVTPTNAPEITKENANILLQIANSMR
ncbi:MAG TPA: DUF2275 domain-containing protein [Thermoanaerobacter sp.]|uniref:Anti-sigma-W factor RsiW n=1 Tax=Thermoanaerobacter pentosaceus TaxID=694059 RepID=A0ABT9M7C4_9THEO|nr:DUF2275 domain-containing protein [Thermoanaerobacter pentosaceus]MDP9752034.1 hypothetical protein [Thermoanaerobacter pentosaceus]HHY79503.1 DUF2275 domain-containing protein [Thermoanaerobacter sp.]